MLPDTGNGGTGDEALPSLGRDLDRPDFVGGGDRGRVGARGGTAEADSDLPWILAPDESVVGMF